MGEKEEKGKRKGKSNLFPPTKKKKEGFFSRLFHHKKEERPKEALLKEVKDSHKFILSSGKKIKSIPQMIGELKYLSDKDFKEHINEEKNDIANWINDVFQDKELAEKIRNTNRKRKIIKLLEKEMKKTEKEFNSMKERLQEEELEKVPSAPTFSNTNLSKLIKPPKAPEKLNVKVIKPIQRIWDTVSPPTPPKSLINKNGRKTKSKKQQEELDKLVTLKEEKERIDKKRTLLTSKEKALEEKEKRLYEHETSNKRALENVQNIKKASDHDVRERLAHIQEKQKELQDLKSKLFQDKKKVEEKEELLDNLRKKYLDTIAKERLLEEKETKLTNRENDLKKTNKELQKIKSNLNENFKKLKAESPNLGSRWDYKFNNFSNLKHQLEIKEKEIKPVLSRFEDDIKLLTKKEKTIIDEIKNIVKDKKLLTKKENEITRKINKLIKKDEGIKKKEEEINKERLRFKKKEREILRLENKLKKDREKIIKVKQLKEDTGKLNRELKKVEDKLQNKSFVLLDLPKKEKELDNLKEDIISKKSEIEQIGSDIKSKISKYKAEQERKEEEIEEKFHSYLQQKLVRPDINLVEKEKPKGYSHNEVYILIDHCRILINLKEVEEAKVLYNEIRKKFMEVEIKGIEKDMLKDTIKELYQQISIEAMS